MATSPNYNEINEIEHLVHPRMVDSPHNNNCPDCVICNGCTIAELEILRTIASRTYYLARNVNYANSDAFSVEYRDKCDNRVCCIDYHILKKTNAPKWVLFLSKFPPSI